MSTVTESDHLVRAVNVCKSFGSHDVLNGIDLEVDSGEVVCLLGPSGSGKTTFLRLINQMESLTGGRIWVGGELIGVEDRKGKLHVRKDKDIARQRSRIGMVFQRFNLFPHMTAVANVMEAPVKVKGLNRGVAKQEALQLLDMVGLAERADFYPSLLSGGQHQLVSIMRALVVEPEILFLDEPFSALDYEMTLFMREQLQRIFMETGTTTVLVSHDLEEAVYLADRVLLLSRHPARIADFVRYETPRPRTDETLSHPDFVTTKAHCLEIFQREVRRA